MGGDNVLGHERSQRTFAKLFKMFIVIAVAFRRKFAELSWTLIAGPIRKDGNELYRICDKGEQNES
jgi:hypothetical protein